MLTKDSSVYAGDGDTVNKNWYLHVLFKYFSRYYEDYNSNCYTQPEVLFKV